MCQTYSNWLKYMCVYISFKTLSLEKKESETAINLRERKKHASFQALSTHGYYFVTEKSYIVH